MANNLNVNEMHLILQPQTLQPNKAKEHLIHPYVWKQNLPQHIHYHW